ncbi:MAG TPA: hypothetical protein VIV40_36785 [Kofleriaceae bacterium]
MRAFRDRKRRALVRIETGLPSTIGFSSRAAAPPPTFGSVWVVGNIALRGDVELWLRVLDADTRRQLGQLVREHRATLQDGVLELHAVTDAVVHSANELATRMREALASTDDSVLFDACRRGAQRERLVALTLVRSRRGDDPRTKGLLAELDASMEPAVQMLADLSAARWSRILGHADNTRFDEALLAETIETLRALYPAVEVPPAAGVRGQLKAICTALSGG